MSNHVYKITQLAGSSSTSVEDAIETAIAKAAKTVRNMDWFEVIETRGQIEEGKVAHYQVILNIGFRLED
jgi:flavin-binding protein dodecin